MLNKVPQYNQLELSRLEKITTMNPSTAAGSFMDINNYPKIKDVGEWFIVGYYKKSQKLLIIPSETNTSTINKAFDDFVLERNGDVLTVHSNIINYQNLLFQAFESERDIESLNKDAEVIKNIKIA